MYELSLNSGHLPVRTFDLQMDEPIESLALATLAIHTKLVAAT